MTELCTENFERAADAVVNGDVTALAELLRLHPGLHHERSVRDHHSTLLHYVSANGVEDFRQKTPPNVLEVAELLLRAGANVNAESDAYGGGSTALGLTATSVHPERAGVQIDLLKLLIAHGAAIEGPNGGGVNSCLRNGRGLAAEFLADCGARLDLEAAAGVGRLDLVRDLLPSAAEHQVRDGFNWACEFGRGHIVNYLLAQGVEVGMGLHWAALGGRSQLVRILLGCGALINGKDPQFSATPLGWAIHGRSNGPDKPDLHNEVIGLLTDAGGMI